MRFLQVKSRSPAPAGDAVPQGAASRFAKRWKVLRSMAFFVVAIGWLFVVGLVLRLVVWPLALLRPSARPRLMDRYLRFHGRFYLRLAGVLAGVRFRVRGQLPPGPCVVVMNHQGIFDILLLLWISQGPTPKIPARDRYLWGIPGVSPMLRANRFPIIGQKRETLRADLEAIAAAAREVARGEGAMAIYPEGHRTRDGEIGPFMIRGLRTILENAGPVPVWCIVADGMWGARTFADTAVQIADARITADVVGPFAAPQDPAALDGFIGGLRDQMVQHLAEMRAEGRSRGA
ncbi:MAG TPA: lysophospholipid acyltransferase family protein [Longimicrobiaceae bacterium]|nr:lysophospholipid acyltransferase family protein [Longimicrobiaceae bacterium]